MRKHNTISFSMNRILSLMIYIFVNTILFIIVYLSSEKSNQLEIMNYATLFQLFISVLILRKHKFSFFSVPIIFIILSYFFHIGQLPLLVFEIQADMPWRVIDLIGINIYIESLKFVMQVHFTLVLGILLYSIKTIRIADVHKENEQLELNRIFTIGKIFVFLGLFPNLYYEMKKFFAYITIGYGSTGITPVGVISVLMNLFYIGLILMLIGKKDDIKYSRNLIVFSIIMFILMMISGSRGEKVVRLIVMISVYFTISFNKKIKVKTITKYVVLGYFGLTFINFVSDMRSRSFAGYSGFVSLFIKSLTKNPLFEAMGEFGGTFISTCYSCMFFPSNSKFLYGSSYIKGLSMIFLNIGGFIDNFRNEIIYVYQFPIRYQTSLGGSYIGELYANFGHGGILVAIPIGVMIGYLARRLYIYSETKNWIHYSVIIIIFSRLIWWIRDYYGNMVREIVWICLLLLFMNSILRKYQK